MRVRVQHAVGRLEADMVGICKRAPVDLRDVVLRGIRAGNQIAKDYARATSGTHARLYPGTFSATMNKPFHGVGVSVYQGEYGPVARGQGKLAGILENGSRNNPAHRNLARSQDRIGPSYAQEVGEAVDRWFW